MASALWPRLSDASLSIPPLADGARRRGYSTSFYRCLQQLALSCSSATAPLLLQLRCLLLHRCSQIADCRFQLLHLAMFFEELVEQHVIDLLVVDCHKAPKALLSSPSVFSNNAPVPTAVLELPLLRNTQGRPKSQL